MSSSTFREILMARGVNHIVVLRRRETPCPRELEEVLEGLRDVVETVNDPLDALARFCVWVRSDQPRIARGMMPNHVVVFLYPEREWASDQEAGIGDFIAFVKERLPMISLWCVSDAGMTMEMNTWIPAARSAGDPLTQHPLPNPAGSGDAEGSWEPRLIGSFEDPSGPVESEAENPAEPEFGDGVTNEGDPPLDQRRTTEVTSEELDHLLGDLSEEPFQDQDDPDSEKPEDAPQ